MQHPQVDVRVEQRIPEALERYRTAVASELEAALALNRLALYDMVRYHLGWLDLEGRPVQASPGKALRPALCLLSCHLAGGEWQEALPAAIALELVHNFSLIHDDIQDGDTERRHRSTVWCIWGQAQAIGAGNAMQCLADRALLELTARGSAPIEVVLDLSATLAARSLDSP